MIAPLRDAPRGRVPEVRNAYRFLKGAHTSVAGLLDAVATLSTARRGANADARGRMREDEVNTLRSALVFTSSGLDASMTRLVWDAGEMLVSRQGTQARTMYELAIKQELAQPKLDEQLRDAIIHADPATEIRTHYLRSKTKASFQGSNDLKKRVRNVLGIPKSRIPDADLEALDQFFEARNRIVHSMDYADVVASKRRTRVHRSSEEVTAMCDAAFGVAADLIRASADLILAHR